MKASHFNIGRPGSDMVNPKPIEPIESKPKIADFNVEEAKKTLRMASWTVGQSPMKYTTVTQASYPTDGKSGRATQIMEQRKQLQDLKGRISSSSVVTGMRDQPGQDLYQTYQHQIHGSFGNVPRPDPKLIADQKMRLSKSNFHLG